jgi:hypothetical protein
MQQDVSCLTASINRFHPVRHSTVSLNCVVVVNHIPLFKESRCCAARFCFICTDAIWRITCSILYQVPIFIGLPGIPGLVLYTLWTTAHVLARRRYFNQRSRILAKYATYNKQILHPHHLHQIQKSYLLILSGVITIKRTTTPSFVTVGFMVSVKHPPVLNEVR